MPIYRIPMIKRMVTIGNPEGFNVGVEMHWDIDGVGVGIMYYGDKPLVPGFVQKHYVYFFKEVKSNCSIEAKNKREAVRILKNKRRGEFMVGEKKPMLRIDEGKEIVKLPSCNFLKRTDNGSLLCNPHYYIPNNHSFCVMDASRAPNWDEDFPTYPEECPVMPILKSLDM